MRSSPSARPPGPPGAPRPCRLLLAPRARSSPSRRRPAARGIAWRLLSRAEEQAAEARRGGGLPVRLAAGRAAGARGRALLPGRRLRPRPDIAGLLRGRQRRERRRVPVLRRAAVPLRGAPLRQGARRRDPARPESLAECLSGSSQNADRCRYIPERRSRGAPGEPSDGRRATAPSCPATTCDASWPTPGRHATRTSSFCRSRRAIMQLLAGVHDERTVPRDRLAQRLAADEQEPHRRRRPPRRAPRRRRRRRPSAAP